MEDLFRLSQLDLFFMVKDAAPAIAARSGVLSPMMTATYGEGWAATLETDATRYRSFVDRLFVETAETAAAVAALTQMLQDVGDWRAVAVGVARNAPKERKAELMKAAGWGLGHAESPKEMKDLLAILKARVLVQRDSFIALGMEPELLDLPARVFDALEAGSGNVAREKAEDDRARGEVKAYQDRLVPVLTAAWRAAETVPVQSRLLARKQDASPERVAEHQARAKEATALAELLTRLYAESRIESRKRAEAGPLPPGLADEGEDTEPQTDVEQPAA